MVKAVGKDNRAVSPDVFAFGVTFACLESVAEQKRDEITTKDICLQKHTPRSNTRRKTKLSSPLSKRQFGGQRKRGFVSLERLKDNDESQLPLLKTRDGVGPRPYVVPTQYSMLRRS
jgi:hypothetical protein